jgi:GNAT superfamily N-acetyltransferase
MLREMGELPEPRVRRYGPIFTRWFLSELRAGAIWGVVAETPKDRVVAGGLLWLQPRPPSPRFPQRRTPYVFSVYTEPGFRRRGLGGEIVRRLVGWAASQGYPRVELHATEIGRNVYERIGFRPTNQMRFETPKRVRPTASRPSR